MLPSARLASVLLASTGLALAGCAPTVADGARAIYSVSQICPAAGISVTSRSDLAPHTVLKGNAPPGVDSVAETYEIVGCQQKQLFVCANPVIGNRTDAFSAGLTYADDGAHLSLNTEYFTLVRGLDVDGDRIASAVVCQPAGPVTR